MANCGLPERPPSLPFRTINNVVVAYRVGYACPGCVLWGFGGGVEIKICAEKKNQKIKKITKNSREKIPFCSIACGYIAGSTDSGDTGAAHTTEQQNSAWLQAVI
ncbi:unnamed protein product [Discosporangium mesarthrocarpum]